MTRWILALAPFLLAASCDVPPVPPVPPEPAPVPTVDAGPPTPPEVDAGELTRCERAGAQAISLGCPTPRQGSWTAWVDVCEHNERRGIDMQADRIEVAKTCDDIEQLRRGDVR